MDIQFNTDSSVEGKQALEVYMSETISEALARFSDKITRIEVHVSDENGDKKAPNDKKCVLEARLKGLDPIAVTGSGDTIKLAVTSAITKIKAALDTTLGRLSNKR
jgi:hypothetical protein